jgi:hypothetical protein
MDQKIEKWIRWLEQIRIEVQQLVNYTNIYKEIGDVWNGHPLLMTKPHLFPEFLGSCYATHLVAGVRRQIKIDSNSISLMRLLREIIDNPKSITRSYYHEIYGDGAASNFADVDFDKYCACPGDEFIDVGPVTQDMTEFKIAVRKIEKYADKRVAHTDKSKPQDLTYGEVNEGVGLLSNIYRRYDLLINARNRETLMQPLPSEWKDIFRFPWLDKDIHGDK